MKLQYVAAVVVVGLSIMAGLDKLSPWWVLIPVFFAGSFSLANSLHYQGVIEANRRGSLTVFPITLFGYCLNYVILGAIVYGLTRLIT